MKPRVALRWMLCVLTSLACMPSFAQTILPPELHCAYTLGNGQVQLDWTLPNNPCGAFISYNIFSSNNFNGPYTQINMVTDSTQTNYLDATVNGNSDTIYYYMTANYNCGSGAVQLSSDTLDNLDPVAPLINYVTVNGAYSQLNWSPSPSPETHGYIIYKVVAGNYLPIDTITGNNITSYIDSNNLPGNGSVSYTIAAMDSCGNVGTINILPHNTIYLAGIASNCGGTLVLGWNAYQNWVGGVHQYKIFASHAGQPGVAVDSTTALSDTVAYGNDSLCYYVVAYQNGTSFASQSNTVCPGANPNHSVSDLYLHTGTVLQEGVVRLFYSVNPSSDVVLVRIERSEDNTSYNPINAINPTTFIGLLTYDDSTALTDEKSYYYRVVMKDNCGKEDTSNYCKTILLSGYAFSNLTNSLTWDAFDHQLGPTLDYTVQRNTHTGLQTLQTFLSPASSFQENVATLVGDTGTLCYVIDAHALVQLGDSTDTVASRSNELCLDQLVKLGVPNAFAPDGKNNLFKPVLRFTGNKSYSMEIYDRWGGLLFSTKEFDQGWDGTYKGKPVPMGAYAYDIIVVDKLGQKNESKGTVMVVR